MILVGQSIAWCTTEKMSCFWHLVLSVRCFVGSGLISLPGQPGQSLVAVTMKLLPCMHLLW